MHKLIPYTHTWHHPFTYSQHRITPCTSLIVPYTTTQTHCLYMTYTHSLPLFSPYTSLQHPVHLSLYMIHSIIIQTSAYCIHICIDNPYNIHRLHTWQPHTMYTHSCNYLVYIPWQPIPLLAYHKDKKTLLPTLTGSEYTPRHHFYHPHPWVTTHDTNHTTASQPPYIYSLIITYTNTRVPFVARFY